MNSKKETILIAGGTGMVGSALLRWINYSKYDVILLSRLNKEIDKAGISIVKWDPDNLTIDRLSNVDHVINLSGAGIADMRWTKDRKSTIISSRVNSASTLEKYIKSLKIKPKSYISASAVGYYGDCGAQVLTENSRSGDEFLSECCVKWEKAAISAGTQCNRTVILRIGIVLSALGGALPKMIMTKKLGIFSYFGNGQQFCPWIHINDLCRLILTTLEDNNFSGVYNAVAPEQITNKEMIEQIKLKLSSKAFVISVPQFVLKLILGEMANVVLNSNRVISDRIQSSMFTYHFTKVGDAVKDVMDKSI